MKKVRLFAVAAAMGMFAATVNAAPAKVTKEAYKATWGTMDEIVRAEFGGKVVLPATNIVVTKQGRTTDKTKATGVTGNFGSSRFDCYVGLTDEVGKDTNGDGLVDKPLLIATGTPTNGWYFDDLKFWPTVKTSLYYIGMTGDGYGVRFLKPGTEASEGWIVANTHTKLADENAVLEYLANAGLIEIVKDKKTGDIAEIITNKKVVKDTATGKTTVGTIWNSFKAVDKRYGVEELIEDVIGLFDGTQTISGLGSKYGTEVKQVAMAYTADTPIVYNVELKSGSTTTVAKNQILVLEENKYGELVPLRVETSALTGVDLDADRIVVVVEEGSKFTKFATITPKVGKAGETLYAFDWNPETGIFEKNVNAGVAYTTQLDSEGVVAANWAIEGIKAAKGLYKYETPKNTTDKIVINFDMGVYGWSLNVSGINTSKSTMTLVDAKNKEFTTGAVRIDGKWYPTVSDEAELKEFVERMAGLHTPEGDSETGDYKAFYDALKAAKRYSTITWLDGTKDSEYIPENALAHYSAQQCTYLVDEATVPAEQVVVTSNAADINTNQYGVQDLKLTAKVGEVEVGSKTVKVVIAPKYVREYKNGKVTSLKAYHLNGNLYSHTTFNYTAKTSTAVFYAQDGVTAVETVTSAIK